MRDQGASKSSSVASTKRFQVRQDFIWPYFLYPGERLWAGPYPGSSLCRYRRLRATPSSGHLSASAMMEYVIRSLVIDCLDLPLLSRRWTQFVFGAG